MTFASTKYYGVVIAKFKGFITNVNGYFWVMSADNITNGNMWTIYSKKYISETLSAVLDSNGKAYEFDTYKELFAWLAKDE